LCKPVYFKDEERRPAHAGFDARRAVLAHHLDRFVHLIVLDADHQGRRAAPQEPPRRGDARGAEAGRHQGGGDRLAVFVADDGDDQFHTESP